MPCDISSWPPSTGTTAPVMKLDANYPRIQGHEVGAVVEAVGPDCERLHVGDRVAIHPISSCGHCYPCRIGRGNVCDNFSLIGIHEDGGFQEPVSYTHLTLPTILLV